MKNLWAPWRAEYIESDFDSTKTKACIFCAFPKEQKDRDNLLLFRGKSAFVMLNRFPYANGHLMIIPYQHTADLPALPPEAHDELFRTVTEMTQLLKKAYGPEGFNVGMNLGRCAGAGIADHLHVHVVPRWNGDTNFMPLLAEAKVISEHLLATYDRLARLLQSEGAPGA